MRSSALPVANPFLEVIFSNWSKDLDRMVFSIWHHVVWPKVNQPWPVDPLMITDVACLVPSEIFLEEIVEDENQQQQQRSRVKVPDFNQNDNEGWWNREALKTLDLSSNSLTTLPNEIETLNYLIVLNVRVFRTIVFSNCFASLQVQNNQLTSLPDSLRRLRTLEKLILRLVESTVS